MEYTNDDLSRDIERVKRISIVPVLLDVICQTTGMGFAAVARVTSTNWVTCSVRDDIQFGLVPGSQLKLATTICNEIRESQEPVVINNVAEDEIFHNHHTPLMYGFQSYISYPIILKNGEFFGTLCAIDPKPADLENPKVLGMFMAFADLISFHLQQIDLLNESDKTVKNLSRQLSNTLDENRQYQHISHHTLQEPLRKLRVFSGMVVEAIKEKELEKAENLALRIQSNAERFSGMIKDLSDFSTLQTNESVPELIDLEVALSVALSLLKVKTELKSAIVTVGELPSIMAYPTQIEQLFYHLLHNAIKFAKDGVRPEITVSSRKVDASEYAGQLTEGKEYIEISIQDNGTGIDDSQEEIIFDMFSQLASAPTRVGAGFGLTFCRKIIRNHKGIIKVASGIDEGTTVLIILPVS